MLPQVLTVFFASFIAGSLLNQIETIIHNPTSIVKILGDAAPQVAVFFMTYLLLMVSRPLLMLQWMPVQDSHSAAHACPVLP